VSRMPFFGQFPYGELANLPQIAWIA